MQTSLAYIDDVMDRAVAAEAKTPTIAEKDRTAANKKAKKVIGGFRVHDEGAERKALDDAIAARRGKIDQFRNDRVAVRATLSQLGVKPLAVCPTGAWFNICRETGLFILSPDKDARVGISRNAFKDYNEKKIDEQVAQDWGAYLKRLFPDLRCLPSSDLKATLILPDPPADVADVLCKVQALKLTVAAVGDAIRLAEKPSELRSKANTNPKDLWAQAQGYEDYADWIKRDPIIFTEHGAATAIVAQFGDFPIEKQVVDAAVASDALLIDKPSAVQEMVDLATFDGPDSAWHTSMLQQMHIEQRRAMEMQRAMMGRGLLNTGRLWNT